MNEDARISFPVSPSRLPTNGGGRTIPAPKRPSAVIVHAAVLASKIVLPMEQMCYHWLGAPAAGGMFACFPARTILDLQTELLKLQDALAERAGEPVLLGIRLVYDDWFEVEVRTFTDRFGLAAGRELERAIEEAAVMLLELDQVLAELRPASG